ncbi:MarR family winged helix-turn-helix transcriptional regulator [Desulfitobacterium chlororespirans]|uniref:DNA-binding transcriptional regulator, MarR family n=1 Tax=Desulfitobacterium chlororespirans DSM 11544 TaxID=1121395 RepID=A0A1M7SKQ5_9FIRM|nr:MarR family winged helix-turn-helix transcriptional regulator [Desulfitobacterium chlororespirans]SHN59049.1 DNA-binding transcriptional regulator, MarR family [Desulfitobacterium chlororespirans DSM 11544]
MKQQINPKRPSPCHCINIRRASRAVTQFYDDILKPSGITTSQLSLLKHLEIAETATISELAKRMRIDRTTLNRNMKPLIEAEFLEIKQGKDSRTRQILLTDKGKDAVARGWKLWGVAQASLKEYMGEEDLAKLVELLSKLEALAP